MSIARDLPGAVAEKEVIYCRSLSAISKIIRSGKYASTADDNGAIGVYTDDAGKYRVGAYRRWMTMEEKVLPTLREVRDWYKKWMKKIE